jgi:thioredoxin-like negative regulator of GroEL
LLEDRKALLIHFWSPWSRECDDAMPDFITTATLLERNGIAVRLAAAGSTAKTPR